MFEVVYQDNCLLIGIEWEDKVPFIHHHVFHWKLSTHKKMKEVFNSIIQNLQNKEHTELWSYYDKNNKHLDKFCSYYGFIKVGETETEYIVLKEI